MLEKYPSLIPFLFETNLKKIQIEESKFDRYVSSILDDSDMCSILDGADATSLMVLAVEALVKRSPPVIPLVMPMSLEALTKKFIEGQNDNSQFKKGTNSQFQMQLLYALLFLNRMPSSSFVIDPRDFPLKEVLQHGRETGRVHLCLK